MPLDSQASEVGTCASLVSAKNFTFAEECISNWGLGTARESSAAAAAEAPSAASSPSTADPTAMAEIRGLHIF